MATTFTWKIANLERETSDGFVFVSHWTVVGISDQLDPEGNPYNSGAYGSVGFERPDNLIPFDELTEELVISWTQEALGGDEKVAEIEAALEARIADQIDPKQASGVPW